jgi:uncharacterized protein YijF (DUF1287 family)
MPRFSRRDFLSLALAVTAATASWTVLFRFPPVPTADPYTVAAAPLRKVQAAPFALALLSGAYAQIGVTTGYDPAYRVIPYPDGDVPLETGVCSDVVIRAYRALGVDLQKEVHQDMSKRFSQYPAKYGLAAPDANIDHRRVPNLMEFFRGRKASVPVTASGADYLPGDVVAWAFPGNRTHIGIVTEWLMADGTPVIVNNSGGGTVLQDILFAFPIIGHYRWSAGFVAGTGASR